MTDFEKLLRLLSEAGVEFIVIGGVAATAHGSARLTQDLDLVYSRSKENLRRLADSLAPHKPYLRGAPPGLPFHWDESTLSRGLNFTLTLDLGDIDLFGEIVGGGSYENLLSHALPIALFGLSCQCLDLDSLIHVKRAAGRPKDLEALAELEALREEAEPH